MDGELLHEVQRPADGHLVDDLVRELADVVGERPHLGGVKPRLIRRRWRVCSGSSIEMIDIGAATSGRTPSAAEYRSWFREMWDTSACLEMTHSSLVASQWIGAVLRGASGRPPTGRRRSGGRGRRSRRGGGAVSGMPEVSNQTLVGVKRLYEDPPHGAARPNVLFVISDQERERTWLPAVRAGSRGGSA